MSTPREMYSQYENHFMGCTACTLTAPCSLGQKLKDDYEHASDKAASAAPASAPKDYHRGRKK